MNVRWEQLTMTMITYYRLMYTRMSGNWIISSLHHDIICVGKKRFCISLSTFDYITCIYMVLRIWSLFYTWTGIKTILGIHLSKSGHKTKNVFKDEHTHVEFTLCCVNNRTWIWSHCCGQYSWLLMFHFSCLKGNETVFWQFSISTLLFNIVRFYIRTSDIHVDPMFSNTFNVMSRLDG